MPMSRRLLGAHRGWVTRTINSATLALAVANPPLPIVRQQRDELESRWKKYEQSWCKYEEENIEDEDDADFQEDQNLHTQKETETKAMMLQLEAVIATASASVTTVSPSTTPILGKLPEIHLPDFYGDLEKWPAFWDIFQSLVHNRTDLTPVVKFAYLRSALKGKAAEAIKGFQTTDLHYPDAITTLKDNFANPKKLQRCLIQKWLGMKSPKYEHKELLSFKLEYESTLRSLKNYVDTEASDWMITEQILTKLPVQAVEYIYQHTKTQYPKLEEIGDGLQSLLELMAQKSKFHKEISLTNTGKPHMPVKQESIRQEKTQIGSYVLSASEQRCLFCQGVNHFSYQCSTYGSVAVRRDRLKELGRCLRCVRKDHDVSNCKTRFTLCKTCGKDNHHGLLCYKLLGTPKTKVKGENSSNILKVNSAPPQAASFTMTSVTSKTNLEPATVKESVSLSVGTKISNDESTNLCVTALPTATGTVRNEDIQGDISCRIFFDPGSQRSFISSKLVKQLKLTPLFETSMKICSFQKEGEEANYQIVNPIITLGKHSHQIKAVVMENMNVIIHSPGLLDLADKLREKGVRLADRNLCSDTITDIEVMIGVDYFSQFIKGFDHIYGIDLYSCSGGKLISGPIPSNIGLKPSKAGTSMHITVMRVTENHSPLAITDLIEEETTDIHKLYDLETIGIQPNEMAPDDRLTLDTYMNSVQYHNGQYWVRLPWKMNSPVVPNNFRMALGQLYSLLNNLKKRSDHLVHYDKVIKDQLQAKFIEIVPNPQSQEMGSCHYLPHHAVEKNSVTTPLRVVFNCSARASKGLPSLNDCLMTGPSLTEKLGNVLTKFRLGNYAYVADISKAFLRVGLQEIDRDYTRFLWVKDITAETPEIVTYRFTSVLFGSTSSPFLLQATLTKHFKDSVSPLKDTLLDNLYVDNLQGTVDKESSLIKIYHEANKEFKKANMPLQAWNSNNLTLRSIIEDEFQEKIPTDVSVLGMNWNTESDTLSVCQPKFWNYVNLTKRKLLSLISSVFDPLGLLSPITIKGKLLMQRAWLEKLEWDTTLPNEYEIEWDELRAELEIIQTCKFPRKVSCENTVRELHVFCDASSKAYGAVAYIVSENESDLVSHLVTSRSRVNPLQSRTIPQMELTAIEVGIKLIRYLVSTLNWKFTKKTLWSDNEASLQWIRNQKSSIIYVQNRVKTILSLREGIDILYVPTNENPADLLSKGLTMKRFKDSDLWFHGPDWLRTQDWPKQKSHVVVNEVTAVKSERVLSPILPYENFSTLFRLLKVTKIVFCFLNIKFNLDLNPMKYWIRFIQNKYYYNVLGLLNCTLPVTGNKEAKKLISDLGLFLDADYLLRCRGRLQNASLPITTRYPILLPPRNCFTKLVINRAHCDVFHGGLSETLAQVRTEYWVPRGRQAVKDVISKCVLCKKVVGKSYKYPGPPPLPDFRVNLIEPFHTTGVDYTGAIQLSKTITGFPQKSYVCLFTCTTSRAVHLELARDLKAETFLLLFRRFCARRSMPKHLISDNATNFQSVSNSLLTIMKSPSVKEYLDHNEIKWHFIAPRAPWQGGFYERLIGVVKICLRKVLYHKRVSEDELSTILTEIETRVNNRPLLYIGDEGNTNDTLTPSHLLHGRRLRTMPTLTESSSEPVLCENNLIMQYVSVSKVIKHFESLWKAEYLTALRERNYGAQHPVSKNNLNLGDVVLVQVERPRDFWPLGKIVQLYPDKDNIVRVVDVLCGGRIGKRTVDKLIPLEVGDMGEDLRETLTVDSGVAPVLPGSLGGGSVMLEEVDSQKTLTVDSGDTPISTTVDSNSSDQKVDNSVKVKRKAAVQSEHVRKALLASGQL